MTARDNCESTLVGYQMLTEAKAFRVFPAYLGIYGYGLLTDQLACVQETCLLLGDPSSVARSDTHTPVSEPT